MRAPSPIDRRHFFIRECVENMQLRVPYVNKVDHLAEFFTKPLEKNDYYVVLSHARHLDERSRRRLRRRFP